MARDPRTRAPKAPRPGSPRPTPRRSGDSAEHAGEQQEGHTVQDPESESAGSGEDAKPRVGDPGPETAQPESEQLANRPS